ncbi:hypothetical protein ACWGNM_05660 [Streptomyces sp. NPDC055796]
MYQGGTDLGLCAESVRELWHADRPLAGVAERVRLLERFPELQPNEEGITDVADTYALFAALCLRYAMLAHSSGNADTALSCGHAALTAMGMLDQNVPGARFLAEEPRLQSLSMCGDPSGLWDASPSAPSAEHGGEARGSRRAAQATGRAARVG